MSRGLLVRLFVLGTLLILASCKKQSKKTEKVIEFAPAEFTEIESLAELHLDARVNALVKGRSDADADSFLAEADRLKPIGRYEDAAVNYLAALKLDPKHVLARYQFACNLALWGHRRMAIATIRQAIDDGFWGYEMMKDDDDLESIRKSPEFNQMLAKVKERYSVEAAKRVGQSRVVVPEGDPPAKGWPVVVFLHGMGDHAGAYVGHAEEAAELGYAGLALSGPVVQWDNQHAWPSENFETTHNHLQKVLADHQGRSKLNPERVFLVGFSQGAVHAAGLLASHPGSYSGAIVLSPGGPPGVPRKLDGRGPPRPMCVIYGQKELLGNVVEARDCAAVWKNAKWPLLEEKHPGTHHFPFDWESRFSRLLKWLDQNSK
jgi:predicted esterase